MENHLDSLDTVSQDWTMSKKQRPPHRPTSDREPRSAYIGAKVTEALAEQIKKAAEAADLTVSTWIKRACVQALEKRL
jgi:hypothetical protein